MVELRDMKNVVTIGGGTGSYTILSGLKHVPDISLTALVSMADDGGSTGVLRDELGVLPPGDVRQCLIALSEHSDVVRNLMSYRFEEGTLLGHTFGNIFLAALEKVTGDFVQGIEIASEILKVKGKVIPITSNKAELVVSLGGGEKLLGENELNHSVVQEKGIIHIGYKEKVTLNAHAKEAITSADAIVLGPGNYYCSIVPNLIVTRFKEALFESHAKLIFPVNLTNKQGYTLGWKVSDYVQDIEKYLGKSLDCILVNNESPSENQITHYKMEEGDGVLTEDDMGDDVRVIREKLLSRALIVHNKADSISGTRSFIRHDKDKLAKTISKIL